MAKTKTTAFFVTKNGDASAPFSVARGAASAPDTLSGYQRLVALARLMGRQAALDAFHGQMSDSP